MSLDKAIYYGKEKRKQYRRAAKHVRSCRPNGGCPYCESNRFHSERKRVQSAEDKLKDV